jgi:lipoate-protein ligase A
VSGNSLRVKRNVLIYHGTMICDFDTATISQCLGTPARQPDYRENRSHEQFVSSIPATTEQVKTAITDAWQAKETAVDWPEALTKQLADEKYRSEDWLRRVP